MQLVVSDRRLHVYVFQTIVFLSDYERNVCFRVARATENSNANLVHFGRTKKTKEKKKGRIIEQ